MSSTTARQGWSDSISRAAFAGERVVIRRYGKEVAAVVPIADLKLLEQLEDEEDLRAARRARKEKGSIPWEKAKAQLGR